MKKFTIFNTRIDLSEWQDALDEEHEENPENFTSEYDDYDCVYIWMENILDDFRDMLSRYQYDLPILIIADVGLWDGRRNGYKELESGNLSDILSMGGDTECTWYCDGKNICCDESHHDGENYLYYRKVTDEDLCEKLLDKFYETGKWDKELLNECTESVAQDVAKALGITTS